jgi:hypothetical protein
MQRSEQEAADDQKRQRLARRMLCYQVDFFGAHLLLRPLLRAPVSGVSDEGNIAITTDPASGPSGRRAQGTSGYRNSHGFPPQTVMNPVFRRTAQSFAMVYGPFGDGEPLAAQERRQEAVQAVEHRDFAQRSPAHDADATAAVADLVAGDPITIAVGHPR